MNDPDATTLIDRLAAGLPDTAPPPGLAARGRALRHRRRRTTLVAGLAAVVLVVAGVAVAPRLLDGGSTPAPAGTVDEPFPDPPLGMKWVGQGQVVVAVPQDWPVTDGVCGSNLPYAVVTETDVNAVCSLEPTLQLGRVSIRRSDDARERFEPRRCQLSDPPTCTGREVRDGIAVSVTVTALDAVEQVDRILDSVMVLPDGWTTVPFVSNARPGERVSALEDAGFDVTVRDRADLYDARVAVEPDLGAPIEVGGSITVSPGEQPVAPEMVARPSIVTAGQEFDLLFPQGATRGLGFGLTGDDGSSYGLAAAFDDMAPRWVVGDSIGVKEIGITGAGPDSLVVPPTAAPGRYRLCAREQLCTWVTVTD